VVALARRFHYDADSCCRVAGLKACCAPRRGTEGVAGAQIARFSLERAAARLAAARRRRESADEDEDAEADAAVAAARRTANQARAGARQLLPYVEGLVLYRALELACCMTRSTPD